MNNEPTRDAKSVWKNTKSIALLVTLVLVLILLFQNFHTISIRLFFWNVEMPQLLAGFLVLIIGFLLGFFAPRAYAKRKT